MEQIFEGMGFFMDAFYHFGVAIWNLMLSLIGFTAAQTPETFSQLTWGYVNYELWPWMVAIGASLLNISFYIGFMRQASNLKQDFTVEIFVECGIKVVAGNFLMLNGINLMKLFFEIASLLAGGFLTETPVIFAQADTDMGSLLFYFFFGTIFLGVCIVCSGMIFLTVYGRYLQLYLLLATAPIAFGTLPGGQGISQTAFAWMRTFFAKVFEVVLIVIAIVIASKMCNAIDFGSLNGIAGVFDGAVQALQNMATMVLLTASVKGMDVFMRRTFAL